jgi:hypothetical protein
VIEPIDALEVQLGKLFTEKRHTELTMKLVDEWKLT